MDASTHNPKPHLHVTALPSFEAIFNASVDCLKIIDPDGILLRICHRAQDALEYEGECPALGLSWFNLWTQPYRDMAHAAVAAAQSQGSGHFVGFCPTFRGNPRWWDVLVSALHGPNDLIYFLVASRDVTRLKQQERENLQAIHELERERLNREQFVATLTHDLRNPLSAARTSAQLIIRKTQKEDRAQGLATRIDRCLERADAMITDLLDAAKIRAGQTLKMGVEAIDLKLLVDDTLHDLCLSAGPRFVLICNVPFVDALSNQHAFRRILENLANNALKYGDPQAQVTVRLDRRPREVLLKVHNTGPAISAADQNTLFDVYRRTSSADASKQEGWGLGLTVVRGLAEALGGEVWVESCPKEGTTFAVRLPQPPEQEVNVTRVPPGETESPLGDTLKVAEAQDTHSGQTVASEHAPRWLETVLASVTDAVVASTADGRISLLNRAATKLCGYPQEEAVGMLTRRILRRRDGEPDHLHDYTRRPLCFGEAVAVDMQTWHRAGQKRDVEGHVTPLYDDAGSPLGLVYILRAAWHVEPN